MSRPLSLVSLGLITATGLSLAAQQPTVPPAETRVATSAGIRATLARARTHALGIIQGNALDASNGPLNGAVVRLRDARFGRIADNQLTDPSGLFEFEAIEPGSYIVELMSTDESILAASQLLNVDAGQTVLAVVKLPFRTPAFASLMGATNMPSAAVVAGEAIANGVAALVPTIPVSPVQ
jgi:hypothetical protein